MANEGPTAGSVFLEFKAELEGVNRAFATINQKLEQMGVKGQQAGQKVQQGSAAAASGFDAIERASVRAAAKVASAASRMLALQFAISGLLTGPASLGKLGFAITSVGQGLAIFATLAEGAKGKAQLFAAGIAGLAVALLGYVTKALEDSIKGTDKLANTTEAATRRIDALKNALADANRIGAAFGQTFGERMSAELELSKASLDQMLKRLRDIKDERTLLRQEANGSTDVNNPIVRQIQALDFEEERTRRNIADLERTGAGKTALAQIGKAVDETNKLTKSLDTLAVVGEKSIAAGLSTPLQVAEVNLKAAEALLLQLIERERQVDELLKNGNLTQQQRADLLSRKPTTEIGSAKSDVEKARRELAAAQAPQKFADTFATPFAQGIADGMVRGIQEGKSAVETLAGIGENLFNNFLSKSADNFVSLMSQGFTAIAGAGGDILGNLFTGLAGVAGALFAQRKGKGGSKFDAVESAVTSTQEVRGIVAGPTSIAVAEVENDLARAVVPVVAGIEETNSLLFEIKRILGNGGGRGGAPGRFPAASTAG